jgi:hypothetical protein
MSWKAKALGVVFGAAVLGGTGLYVKDMAYDYSDGTRTGTVFKLSHKGVLCKTWEGQMNMDGYGVVDGQGKQVTSAWDFTVMNKDLLPKFEEAERTHERVEITYRQVKWKLSCLQESDYVATDIKKVDGQGQAVPFVIAIPQPRPKR